MNLYIGNLNYNVREGDLRGVMEEYGTDFEYLEWAENGDLDGLMEMSALELLKKLIEEQ